MRARIYQPPKNAMQSGRANTESWILEFEPTTPQRPDPLMGWIGGTETLAQVRLHFPTCEEAVAFARRDGLSYEVELPHVRRVRPKAYAENFAFGRREMWTH